MTSEKILSTAAVIISTLALLVSFWQAWDNREFNKLSVRPYLQVNPKLMGKETGLYLENAGTGNAFINSITMTANGKTFDLIENSSSDFLKSINVTSDCYVKSWPRKGAAIQAGKEFPLMQISEKKFSQCYSDAVRLLTEPNAKINISYMSPYNEEFELSDTISLTKRELGTYYEAINKLRNTTTQ